MLTPPAHDPAVVRSVSRFEANLIQVLRCFLRQAPIEHALRLIGGRTERQPCLSLAAVEVICDSLSKGCVLYLARQGGWRRDRFLREGEPRDGRIWERTTPSELALIFSRQSLEFLIWIVASKVNELKSTCQLNESELTPADQLFLFLAYETLRETETGHALVKRSVFFNNALCRLAFPDDFGTTESDPDFRPWMTGLGATILEALQHALKTRWLQLERRKGQIGDWTVLDQIGRSQTRVLEALTVAAETASRPDLVRFALEAAAELLTPGQTLTYFTGGLQGWGPPRLADRVAIRRNALALVRYVERLAEWQRRARSVGYIDEGYAASQMWKADWERVNGDELAQRACELFAQADPLAARRVPPNESP